MPGWILVYSAGLWISLRIWDRSSTYSQIRQEPSQKTACCFVGALSPARNILIMNMVSFALHFISFWLYNKRFPVAVLLFELAKLPQLLFFTSLFILQMTCTRTVQHSNMTFLITFQYALLITFRELNLSFSKLDKYYVWTSMAWGHSINEATTPLNKSDKRNCWVTQSCVHILVAYLLCKGNMLHWHQELPLRQKIKSVPAK